MKEPAAQRQRPTVARMAHLRLGDANQVCLSSSCRKESLKEAARNIAHTEYGRAKGPSSTELTPTHTQGYLVVLPKPVQDQSTCTDQREEAQRRIIKAQPILKEPLDLLMLAQNQLTVASTQMATMAAGIRTAQIELQWRPAINTA